MVSAEQHAWSEILRSHAQDLVMSPSLTSNCLTKKSQTTLHCLTKKRHNVTCGNPFLQKFPEFLDFLQLRVSTAQKGIEDVLAADS